MTRTIPTTAAYDDQAIWGVGHTEIDAVNDALEFSAQHAEDNGARLLTATMTPELAEMVDTTGGAVAFHILRDGRLGTWAEWEAE